jgi:hypothetical protein
MANSNVPHTIGELMFAILLAFVCALLAAIVGFVGAIFLCQRLLVGEKTEWAFILAPVGAILFGVPGFLGVFRGLLHFA